MGNSAVKPVLFLDINGVISILPPAEGDFRVYESSAERRNALLQNIEAVTRGHFPAIGVQEFYAWAREHFQVVWISSWTKGEEPHPLSEPHRTAVAALFGVSVEEIDSIPSASWTVEKLEAVQRFSRAHPTHPWVWMEDEFSESTRAWASQQGYQDRLILVESERKRTALEDARKYVEGVLGRHRPAPTR